MNKKAFGTTIQEIASSIAKDIFPGKKALVSELNQTILNNPKLNGKFLDDSVRLQVSAALDPLKSQITNEQLADMVKSVHAKTYATDIDNLASSLSQYTDKSDEVIQNILKYAKTNAQQAVKKGVSLEDATIKTSDKVLRYPGAYFMNPDKKVQTTRVAAAVSTYAGVAVGGRLLSGGTLTTDNYGRKDIVGVPFL